MDGLVTFLKQVWGGIVGIVGVVSAILGYIELAQGNLGLFTLVLLLVGVAGLFLSCFYYSFVWQPEVNDGKSGTFSLNSEQFQASQAKKVKRRKKLRWIARLGLLLIPVLVWGGYRYYQDQAQLPPTDFKILVANFESSDSSDLDVTQEIFANLQTEMRDYGDDVKVKKLGKTLESIQAAKEAGKEQKAAIVIWGNYQVIEEVVPIRVNFEILKESTDYFELDESVQGKTQLVKLSELNSFNLQTNLSQEMTYLSLFTLGMYRYLDDDWEQAISYYQRALEISATNNQPIASLGRDIVNYYLGNSSYLLELYEQALKYYDQAIAINPDYDAAWNNRGLALNELGKYEPAITSYDQAIAINPDLDAAWYNRGNALNELGKYEPAITSYDKAIAINPDYDAAWNNRGNAFSELGKYEPAITSYDKAIAINPDLDEAWNNRGNALYELGKYEPAITSYDKAIAINPDYDAAWNNRGNAFSELGKYEPAITSYDKAIAINPDLDEAWNNRGVTLGELGKYEQAITSFDKAIKSNPDDDAAWYNVAVTYAQLNDFDSTLKNLKQAFSLNAELRKHAKTNSVFDALRADQRFQDLMKE